MNKMSISADGIAVMHHYESCELEAYPDPGSKDGNPWTIGWGHTGPEVHKGLVWTQEKADDTFKVDVGSTEREVLSLTKVKVTQCQFDALVSFVYNVGDGAFFKSTLRGYLNQGDFDNAAKEFARWNKNDGTVMKGLTRRRASEAALFNGADAKTAIAAGVASDEDKLPNSGPGANRRVPRPRKPS